MLWFFLWLVTLTMFICLFVCLFVAGLQRPTLLGEFQRTDKVSQCLFVVLLNILSPDC